MRVMLLLLALVAGGAAFYLAGDRGVGDPAVIAVAAVAVFALALFRMTPSTVRPQPRGSADAPRSPAYRREAGELAENLEALARARAPRNEEAFDSRNTVAVYLSMSAKTRSPLSKCFGSTSIWTSRRRRILRTRPSVGSARPSVRRFQSISPGCCGRISRRPAEKSRSADLFDGDLPDHVRLSGALVAERRAARREDPLILAR